MASQGMYSAIARPTTSQRAATSCRSRTTWSGAIRPRGTSAKKSAGTSGLLNDVGPNFVGSRTSMSKWIGMGDPFACDPVQHGRRSVGQRIRSSAAKPERVDHLTLDRHPSIKPAYMTRGGFRGMSASATRSGSPLPRSAPRTCAWACAKSFGVSTSGCASTQVRRDFPRNAYSDRPSEPDQ